MLKPLLFPIKIGNSLALRSPPFLQGHEDVVYLPGRMLLFSGDQLHAVSPYRNPISSDRRIVLQGHGIFQNHTWWLFGWRMFQISKKRWFHMKIIILMDIHIFFIWRSGGFIQFNYFLAVNIVHIATLDDWWLTFWFHIVSVEVFQTKNDRQGFPSNVVFFDISYSSFLAWMIGGSSLDVGDLLGHPWVSSTKKSWQHVWSNDALSMIYSSWFKRKQFWRITDLLRCTPVKLCCVDSSKATSVCGRRAIQKNLHWRSDNASPGWIHP